MLFVLTALLSAAPVAAATPPLPPQPMAYTPAPATPAPTPDPAKLAVATRIAAKIVPDGSYRSLMDGLMANLQQGVVGQMTALPVRDLAKAAGVPEAKLAGMGKATLRDILAILDPNFDERLRRTTTAMLRAMTDAFAGMEPTMREGMAIAYANHFTAAQLADIDAFFASPTGAYYAAENLKIVSDPAFQSRMQAMMKSVTARMPAILTTATAATADLPKPRAYADLTPADKAKLAALLGVDPATLK